MVWILVVAIAIGLIVIAEWLMRVPPVKKREFKIEDFAGAPTRPVVKRGGGSYSSRSREDSYSPPRSSPSEDLLSMGIIASSSYDHSSHGSFFYDSSPCSGSSGSSDSGGSMCDGSSGGSPD